MKKIMIILLLVIITAASFSQQIEPSQAFTKQDYLKKSKNQKTAAWIMLGGGFALTSTALAVALAEVTAHAVCFFCDPEVVTSHQGLINTLAITGTVAMIGSIPLFSAGARNKRRAAELSFKNEKTLLPDNNSLAFKNIPSLSLKIRL